MDLIQLLRCPVCHGALHREQSTLLCDGARAHGFDLAAAGYVNLALAKASGGGDDAELIRARSSFLEKGYYAPIAHAVCDRLVKYCGRGATVLDAGCGEGYYSLQMADKGMSVLGVDLSKRGILHAAKAAKRGEYRAFFAVGGIFELPVADHSVDAVVSLFAPVCEEEFLRVLKPGGHLILVGAGPRHLYSLKEVLYDTPYLNEARADEPQSMTPVARETVAYKAQMDNETLGELFSMTPYYYRTSREGQQRLAGTASLDVDVEVEIAVYRT